MIANQIHAEISFILFKNLYLVAKKTPSPADAERRKLRPGSGGDKPPDEPPFTYQLKAVPLKFVKEIKDIVLTEAESIGSSAIFECLISPSTAITTWMKDGSNIRESPKHRFTTDGKDRKLHIIDVQLSDAGEYTCVLKLGNKEKTSTAKLIVEGIHCTSKYVLTNLCFKYNASHLCLGVPFSLFVSVNGCFLIFLNI